MPPDMPAAMLRPVAPRITARPPVMYSQRVVAHALDDGQRTGVADAEPLADPAAQEDLAAGGAVADDVAGDDVVLGGEGRLRGRADDDPPAGQALADVVVGVAVRAAW